MSTMKQVVITIDVDGSSVVDAIGFKGVGCAAATEQIELALGGGDPANKSDKKKPEYAMNPGVKQVN